MGRIKKKTPRTALFRKPATGIWYVRISFPTGEKEYRSLETTNKRDAEGLRRAMDDRLAEMRPKSPNGNFTLYDLGEKWKEWASAHLQPSTVDSYIDRLNAFINGCPERVIAKISKADLLTCKTRNLKKYNASTVNNGLGCVRAMISRAISEGWYSGPNPLTRVDMIRIEEKIPRWLSREEIERVLWAAALVGKEIYLFCALGIFSGMRKAEIDAARWEWVDFDRKLLHIDTHRKNKQRITIPLHDRLALILGPFRTESGFIVNRSEKSGSPITFDRRLKQIGKAAGVENLHPHLLRHTFASLLVGAGVSIYKVQRWLGHKNIATTMRYSHLAEADDDINRF